MNRVLNFIVFFLLSLSVLLVTLLLVLPTSAEAAPRQLDIIGRWHIFLNEDGTSCLMATHTPDGNTMTLTIQANKFYLTLDEFKTPKGKQYLTRARFADGQVFKLWGINMGGGIVVFPELNENFLFSFSSSSGVRISDLTPMPLSGSHGAMKELLRCYVENGNLK